MFLLFFSLSRDLGIQHIDVKTYPFSRNSVPTEDIFVAYVDILRQHFPPYFNGIKSSIFDTRDDYDRKHMTCTQKAFTCLHFNRYAWKLTGV